MNNLTRIHPRPRLRRLGLHQLRIYPHDIPGIADLGAVRPRQPIDRHDDGRQQSDAGFLQHH
jgi:hypothetical protein